MYVRGNEELGAAILGAAKSPIVSSSLRQCQNCQIHASRFDKLTSMVGANVSLSNNQSHFRFQFLAQPFVFATMIKVKVVSLREEHGGNIHLAFECKHI